MHGAAEDAYKNILAFEALDDWGKLGTNLEMRCRNVENFKQTERKIKQLKKVTNELSIKLSDFLEGNLSEIEPQSFKALSHCISMVKEGKIPDAPELNFKNDKVRHMWNEIKEDYRTIHSLSKWNKSKEKQALNEEGCELIDKIKDFIKKYDKKLSSDTLKQLTNCIQALKHGYDLVVPDFRLNYTKLSVRPGIKYIEDPTTMDLIEELIYHSIKAGNEKDAYTLYNHRLGGRWHLGKGIGEYARGVRILRSFPTCPNLLDLGWYLRGTGDLQTSFKILNKVHPIWSGSVLLLQGYLMEIIKEGIGWPVTQLAAAFLSGESRGAIERDELGWGEALIGADLHLLKGDIKRARKKCSGSMRAYNTPEKVRTNLVLAEIERISGNIPEAQAELDKVAPWILRSCSVEHLCFFHLITTRIMIDQKQYESADSESKEGLHLARRCSFGLYHIDFMNVRSGLFLTWAMEMRLQGFSQQAKDMLNSAKQSAYGALNGILKKNEQPASSPDTPLDHLVAIGAQHPQCSYIWGAIEALCLCLLGKILIDEDDNIQAINALQEAVNMQSHIKHPHLMQTKELLKSISLKD